MSNRITHDQKEEAIEVLRKLGTMIAGAKAAGVTVRTLNEEMRRSVIFKRRVLEAREEGKRNVADSAVAVIMSYAYGTQEGKTDRNRLTAAIALANAYETGFRGTTMVRGKIDHDVRVISAVPRPIYKELPPVKREQIIDAEVKELPTKKKREEDKITEEDKETLRLINAGEWTSSIEVKQ